MGRVTGFLGRLRIGRVVMVAAVLVALLTGMGALFPPHAGAGEPDGEVADEVAGKLDEGEARGGDSRKGVGDMDAGEPSEVLRDETAAEFDSTEPEVPFAPTIEERHIVASDGSTWGFWLYQARPEAAGQPLVLSLHGSGECGDDLGLLCGTSSLSRWILDGTLEPDCDVLMPQCPSFGWDVEALHTLLMDVAAELGSDMSRISCTGVSMGGFGTWDLLNRYPTLFCAAAPVASSGTNGGTEGLAGCTAKIRSLVGTADGYDSSGAVAAVCGGGGTAEQVWVEGAGHGDMCNVYGDPAHNPLPFLLGEE